MNIWLITTGEILPTGDERPCKTAILARQLEQAGHRVIWWTTTFDHQLKQYIAGKEERRHMSPGVELLFLHAKQSYRKNISISRLINHHQVARHFAALAPREDRPDLIYCSFPTIDLSYQAVRFGLEHNLPVVLDVRDLWPDIFTDPFPAWSRWIVRLPLLRYIAMTRFALSRTRAITAVSEGYLKWALNYAGRQLTVNDRIFPLGKDTAPQKIVHQDILKEYCLRHGIDDTKTNIWFVGTFGQTYDLRPVIEAARQLEASGRNEFRFILTGDGEKMEIWTKQAQGLTNIVFTGWASQQELSCLAHVADIGLMAYRENAPQGLPNKIFDYLSEGLPILSSLKGEAAELLDHYRAGLSYQASQPDSLIECLLDMTDQPNLLAQMGQNGKTLFDTQFSSDIIYHNLVSYLENLASGKPELPVDSPEKI